MRSILHRLAHALGINLCIAVEGGYRCVKCGKLTAWEEWDA